MILKQKVAVSETLLDGIILAIPEDSAPCYDGCSSTADHACMLMPELPRDGTHSGGAKTTAALHKQHRPLLGIFRLP